MKVESGVEKKNGYNIIHYGSKTLVSNTWYGNSTSYKKGGKNSGILCLFTFSSFSKG